MNRGDAEATAEGRGQGNGTDPCAALYQAGRSNLRDGRRLDALRCGQQALAIDPLHADSLQLMGLIALQAQQHDHAVEWLSRAILQDAKPEYFAALGFTLRLAGRLDDALAVFDKAVQLRPDDPELWKQLGGALVRLNRPAEALATYQHVLKLDPGHCDAAYASGLLFLQMERFEEALAQFNLCSELQPNHTATLFQRARTLRALKRYLECLADYQRLHALSPNDPTICNNIGDAMLGLDRYQEGLEWFEEALKRRSDFVEVVVNKAFALWHMHRFDEAMAAYGEAKMLDPNDAGSAWQLAHLQLLSGDFERGWAAREARWMVLDFSPEYPKFSQPKWLGEEDVRDKTVLLCADEGLGDIMQFARYVPLLAARGANIVLVVQDALRPLLAGLPAVSQSLPFGAKAFPPFDFHCPITSLPLAFGTTLETIPPSSYLPALPAGRVRAWDARLGAHDRLRVGLVWSGNPKQANDRNRSMPFATLAPLFDLDATFVSLQKEVRPQDATLLRSRTDIIDLTADLTDFVETAALIQNLDLVISVCTSVAHLAGTLGRPTWVMLPYVGDWRWLIGRDDSPWYPTVRLFRQDDTRNFAPVVARVRTELIARIAAFTAASG
jgi:tetratricopeptide (TPR) repeat protein